MDPSEPRRCHGRARSGEQCRRWVTPGAAVCVMHGAATPRVARAARRRLLRALALYYLSRMGENVPLTSEDVRLARAVLRLRQRATPTPRWWLRLELPASAAATSTAEGRGARPGDT